MNIKDLFRKKRTITYSFKEKYEILHIPVLSFMTLDGKELNFIIDTGANTSFINKSAISFIDYKDCGPSLPSYGMDGIAHECKRIVFYFGDIYGNAFDEVFKTCEMPGLLNTKEDYGFEVHGILGCSFLKRAKALIDYGKQTITIR